MSKTVHIGVTIQFLLGKSDAELAKCLNGDNGKHHGKTYRKQLQKMYDEGVRVLQFGDGCDSWDPVKGCPGHERAQEVMTSSKLDMLLISPLQEIKDKAQALVVKLAETKREHPEWQVDSNFNYTESDKSMSAIIELIADLYDRAYGKEGTRSALLKKVRKALGYNMP